MTNMNGNVDNVNCRENNAIEKELKRKDKGHHLVLLQWYIIQIMKHQIFVRKLSKMIHS